MCVRAFVYVLTTNSTSFNKIMLGFNFRVYARDRIYSGQCFGLSLGEEFS